MSKHDFLNAVCRMDDGGIASSSGRPVPLEEQMKNLEING